MNSPRARIVGLVALTFVAAALAANSVFVVGQTSQAIVLRFGQIVRTINADGQDDPGLKVKWPLERVVLLDKRNQALDIDQQEIIAVDQQHLVVDAFLRYRIADPLQFYRTLGDQRTAEDRLERMVNSSLRQVLGSATATDIVSGQRVRLTAQARDAVTAQAKASNLGIQVIDLRIKRVDLPPANQTAVYARMEKEREKEAAALRASGEQQKRTLMAEADKAVAITLAAAHAEAEKDRGEGDAKRAMIFAQSFGRDPSFAAFYRSMQAYDAALAQGDTTFVLSPDSAFFKYFKSGPGR